MVLGGGNIFRGVSDSAQHMDRVQADYMGMLATVINSIALQDALERKGVPTRVMSAISMPQVAEPYIRRRAIRHLEKGGWSSSAPAPATPTSAPTPPPPCAPRRSGPRCLMKATKVDGIYDSPTRSPTPTRPRNCHQVDL